ncbi:LysE/ArgO family amino acid transporter [Rhodospirillum centenum]|uniref:Translocator protein, LysE family protein n=1 Tax=Rhodospirillum centenum (strain ATCC 51521 / SW) TaxID=414684 RepID=B6IQZ5_RHOCS|nr:LysE family transporter [Rhodospirillum centenum]ACI97881.1 translocator protein, LysE family protein [Rhodospirillum centenum SW]
MLAEIGVFLRGIILGIAIAAPVGPIGLLCIRRTLERGIAVGIATGMGAAIADALFSAIAAFGVNAILELVIGHEGELRVFGGLFLLGVALHSFLREPRPPAQEPEARNLLGATGSGLALTMGNPVTILGITALVVGFSGGLETYQAVTLVAGIFVGSGIWWFILCGGVTLVRHRITRRSVLWINRGTGIMLGALGVWALGGVGWNWLVG